MKRLWSKKWLRRTVCSVIVFAVFLFSACWYFGIRSHKDVIAYVGMSRECHPVWKDLALKHVRAGQPIEEVIETTSPLRIERHGAYTTISYQGAGLCFTGITLIARDDRLVAAETWSCTWGHTFFDELSKEERLDWQHSYQAYIEDQIKRREINKE